MKLVLAATAVVVCLGSANAQTAAQTRAPASTTSSPATTPSPPLREHASRSVRHRKQRATQAVARVAAANRYATEQPRAQAFVNAVQVYPYSEGAIYQAYVAPGAVTDIALQAGETLISVASGDTVRWVIGDTTSGSGAARRTHVLVKPFTGGLATNLVITTDRRSYYLQLTATSRTAMAALSWTYPADALIVLRRGSDGGETSAGIAGGLAIEQLHFNYEFGGDRPSWRPIRAFDDGRQTFVEFPAAIAVGEAPPLFVIGPSGEAELVNYRMRGRYYIVDRIFDAAELRLGTKKQQTVRIKRVTEGRRRK